MQKSKFKRKNVIVLFLFLFVCIMSVVGGIGGKAYTAFADSSSSVKDDLLRDENFNAWDYPQNDKDYSIKVIQIAESVNGDLYLYTYQPCQSTCPLVAIEINMSLSETVDGTALYGLTLLDTSGVFGKYKVNGLKVKADNVRYYNITSISRKWIKEIDNGTDNGNTTNKKAYGVGQYWKAITQGDTVIYKMVEVETVEIINPFTSYIRRNKNQSSNEYFQDNYYVAFSTDRNIENLLSATVKYRIQDYFYKENNVLGFADTAFWDKSTFSNEKQTQKDIYCNEFTELQQQGFNLFGIFDLNKNYSWERIQSSADFVKNAGASSADNDEVKKLQWVLMFDETSVYRYQSSGTLFLKCEETGQIIDEVTILRLEFVEDGITYNLGAVSDTVSPVHNFGGNNNGGGDTSEKVGFWRYIWNCIVKFFTGKASGWEKFVAVITMIIVVVVVVLAVKFVKWIIKGLFK